MNHTETFLLFLGEMCAKGFAVLLVATLATSLRKEASAAQRHFIWLAAFAIILILPATRLLSPRWGILVQNPARVSIPAAATMKATGVMEEGVLEEWGPVALGVSEHHFTAPTPSAPAWQVPDWRAILIGAWLAGTVGVLGYRLLGSWRLRRLEHRSDLMDDAHILALIRIILAELGIRRAVTVRVSAECQVPITWGIWRPVLMLPTGARNWSDARITAALRHEAGHISRGDYLVRWIAHLACALHWPNPSVWLAARSLRISQEQATDDLVLRAGTPPEEYASQLFDAARAVAVHGLFARQAVAMATPSTLENRVLAIVDDQRDRRPLSRLAVAMGTLAIGVVLAVCTAAQLQGAEPAAAPGGPGKASSTDATPPIMIHTWFAEIPADGLRTEGWPALPEGKAILGNQEFQVLMRSLRIQKGVNLQAVPRVTTKSDQQAAIVAANEFRYPTDWEKDVAGGWTPKYLGKKNIGSWLDIVPTSKSNDSVEVRLKVRGVEFLGFIDQDDPKSVLEKNPDLLPGKRRKPLFAERELETDGAIKPGEVLLLNGLKETIEGKPAAMAAPGRKLIVLVAASIIEPKDVVAKDSARDRADHVTLPTIELQDKPVGECIAYLQEQGAKHSPDGRGVNLVFHPPAGKQPHITMSLKDLSLSEAVWYVARLADLDVSEHEGALLIQPSRIPTGAAPPPVRSALEKAERIVIPKFELRHATAAEAMKLLSKKARELDTEGEGVNQGVNLVLKPGPEPDRALGFTLTNIPLIEALRYVAESYRLEIVVEPNAIVLQPPPPGAAKASPQTEPLAARGDRGPATAAPTTPTGAASESPKPTTRAPKAEVFVDTAIQQPPKESRIEGRAGIEIRQSNPVLNRAPFARRPGEN